MYTNNYYFKKAIIGFVIGIVLFIIGGFTIVLMPFVLLYFIAYLVELIVLFIKYCKYNKEDALNTWNAYKETFCTPETIHRSAVNHQKRVQKKRRKKYIKRKKRQTRAYVLAYGCNKAIKDIMKEK